MQLSSCYIFTLFTAISTVLATPYTWSPSNQNRINCARPIRGLRRSDCDYLNQIGFAGRGRNSNRPNALIWIGRHGPNLFNFINTSGKPLILIFWQYPIGDYARLFMSAYPPKVSYSLAPGSKVTISVADGVSGGWAGLYDHQTTLNPWGLVQNTWGEFTTDSKYVQDQNRNDVIQNGKRILNTAGRTHVDVTRMVYMMGNAMSIRMDRQPGGCVSDFSRCFFECISEPVTCGKANEYRLVNCSPGSQPGANYGLLWGQPEGGCSGQERKGYVTIEM